MALCMTTAQSTAQDGMIPRTRPVITNMPA